MTYEMNQDGSYKDLEFTNFPAKIDSWEDSEDVSSDYLDAANNYKAALAKGNYATAQNILLSTPKLKNMLIGAKDINELKHAVMAIERLYTEDVKSLITDYSNEVKENTQKATTAASSAMSSKTVAEEKAQETAESLENLKTLKGTLPTDFTEYVAQVNQTADNAVNKTSHDYVKSVEQTENNVTVNFGDDANPVVIDKYSLPVATVDALGGVKAGDNVTVAEDGKLSITANNVAGALGFTPLAPQLPYTITFEGTYLGDGRNTKETPTEITFSKLHDMFLVAKLPFSSYKEGSDEQSLGLLYGLLRSITSYSNVSTYAPMRALPETSASANALYKKIGVSVVIEANKNTTYDLICRVGNTIKISTLSSTSGSYSTLSDSNTRYFVFGVDWNINILQPSLDTATNVASE